MPTYQQGNAAGHKKNWYFMNTFRWSNGIDMKVMCFQMFNGWDCALKQGPTYSSRTKNGSMMEGSPQGPGRHGGLCSPRGRMVQFLGLEMVLPRIERWARHSLWRNGWLYFAQQGNNKKDTSAFAWATYLFILHFRGTTTKPLPPKRKYAPQTRGKNRTLS